MADATPEASETAIVKRLQLPSVEEGKLLRNKALVERVVLLAKAAGVDESGCDRSLGTSVSQLATASLKLKKCAPENAERVAKMLAKDRLPTSAHVKAAISALRDCTKALTTEEEIKAFEEKCGADVRISEAQVVEAVKKAVAAHQDKLESGAWRSGRLVGIVSKELRFASGDMVKDQVAKQTAHIQVKSAPEKSQPNKKKKETDTKGASAVTKTVVLKEPAKGEFPRIMLRDLKDYVGKKITVFGWIAKKRGSAKVMFCQIRDGTGWIQAVFSGDMVLTADFGELREEASVCVSGQVLQPPPGKEAKWTPRLGCELRVDYWKLIGKSDPEYTTRFIYKEYDAAPAAAAAKDGSEPAADSNNATVEVTSAQNILLDNRHLVHRQYKPSLYLRLRSWIVQCFRQHYFDKHYVEITPPTMVQCQAEGGSELFKFDYFGEPAYLTQSSQLYLETVLPAVGDCFCIASSYRAEKSRTRRHLAEYTHLEAEMPFINFEEMLVLLEDLVCDVIQRALTGPQGEYLKEVNPKLKVPERPFVRMEYVDAIEFCRKNKIYKDPETKEFFEFGDDIPEMPERKMVNMIGRPVFLCRFPVEMKAFYMPKCKHDPRLSESVDLLVPGVGEVIGGSMRIHDFDELLAAYKREGIDPSPYGWFTDQRKFGTVPHGGYGLGIERFLVWVLGDDHIKNVALYPRYRGRCTP